MTPVILLSDGFIANGAVPWKIPNLEKDFPKIKTRFVSGENLNGKKFMPYERDVATLARHWAIPGMPSYEHRLGGLEKQDGTGNISYDGHNHENMVRIRREKVARVQDAIPLQTVDGRDTGDLLLVTWGGTYGAALTAVHEVQARGSKVSHIHLRYLNPMPKNLAEIFKGFKKVVVAELNDGQLVHLLNARYHINASSYTKVQGKPFMVRELVGMLESKLEQINQ